MNTTVQEIYGTSDDETTTQAWDFMQVEVNIFNLCINIHAWLMYINKRLPLNVNSVIFMIYYYVRLNWN